MNNLSNLWSEKVNTRETYQTPYGTFMQEAPEVVNILLKVSDGDARLALQCLQFYMNREGKNLTNREQLEQAKNTLEIINHQQ